MQTFGERLKYFREQAGLTQEELATSAGVSQSTVGNLEAGIRESPQAKTLHSLARALRIDPGLLLGEERTSSTQSKLELQLLAAFRSLGPQQQSLAIRLVKALRE